MAGGGAVMSQGAAPAAPPGMVYVEAGPFNMGSDLYQRDEQPIHQVTLDAFFIDITEVTNADYAKCQRSGKCHSPHRNKKATRGESIQTGPNYPVVAITWFDAQGYCKWAGKRLPTEAEWEKAARGTTGNPYPWGKEIDCKHANYNRCEVNHPQPVGSYPDGKSPYGALDMAGNVMEWVSDWYDSQYYSKSPARNPTGPDDGVKKALRGGSYDYTFSSVRTSFRFADLPRNWDLKYGFRCVKSP